MNNRQTHEIPEEGEILEKLSFYFEYENSKDFKKAISKTRDDVRKIYESILSSGDNEETTLFDLKKIEFEDTNKANSDLLYLREGRGIIGTRTFDTQSIQGFLKIENKLYEYLQTAIFPDRVLSNFVRLIRQANFPSIWYQELLDEKFLTYFMKVMEFSQYSIDLLAEDKELRDFFLSRKVFLKIPVKELTGYKIKHVLFYLSVQIITGLQKPINVSSILSKILKIKIKEYVYENAKKYNWNKDYFFAVLGSLGSSVITFYSDLDIIFIARNIVAYPTIEKEVQDILAGLRELLKPFTIDCRLRPEGKSSQLVWDIEDSGSYFQKRARVWEFQTLTKISFISGNKRLFNSFTKKASASLDKFKLKEIKNEMLEMHKRLISQRISGSSDFADVKKGSGGLTDIEFIVQYLLFQNPELYKNSFDKSFTLNLQSLINASIRKSDIKILTKAFELYKSIELFNQVIFNSTTSRIKLDEKRLKTLSLVLNIKSSAKFKEELGNKIVSTKKIFTKVFK